MPCTIPCLLVAGQLNRLTFCILAWLSPTPSSAGPPLLPPHRPLHSTPTMPQLLPAALPHSQWLNLRVGHFMPDSVIQFHTAMQQHGVKQQHAVVCD